MPVWRPERDHSVSPWRTMKTRGGMVGWLVGWFSLVGLIGLVNWVRRFLWKSIIGDWRGSVCL